MGFLEKIRKGLSKTKQNKGRGLSGLFAAFRGVDDEFFDELEERLILADVGVETSMKAVERLRAVTKERKLREAEEVRGALREILVEMLQVGDPFLNLETRPSVLLVIGVNGVGKTTTIGKLANQLQSEGKRVLLCAADTFRAAAADQLEIWANRSGADIVRQHEGADPASVVYDGISSARAKGSDVIIVDTAGRLHNKANLMNELGKISRIIDRELPGCAKDVLLVLDATTGQNGLIQAREFKKIAGVTGIVLTKLDGTAKGGIVIAVADDLHLPVKYVGVGEGIDDLLPFEPDAYVSELI
ncbi:MAG: signal recognition particle-docking protein FtsY [Candidatus Faecousia sp.]|nr:signal recognition particle-docking protein FtsY [Candidatus Faecousia sp.]